MKKILISIIVSSFLMILGGCGTKTHTLKVTIDKFSVPLETIQPYMQIPTSRIQSNFKNELYQVFVPKDADIQTGQDASILITKNDLGEQSWNTRKTNNINTIKSQFTKTEDINIKNIGIECAKEQQLTGLILTIDMKPLYISQLWRSNDQNGYIISALSKDDKEQDILSKSMRHIACQN